MKAPSKVPAIYPAVELTRTQDCHLRSERTPTSALQRLESFRSADAVSGLEFHEGRPSAGRRAPATSALRALRSFAAFGGVWRPESGLRGFG